MQPLRTTSCSGVLPALSAASALTSLTMSMTCAQMYGCSFAQHADNAHLILYCREMDGCAAKNVLGHKQPWPSVLEQHVHDVHMPAHHGVVQRGTSLGVARRGVTTLWLCVHGLGSIATRTPVRAWATSDT